MGMQSQSFSQRNTPHDAASMTRLVNRLHANNRAASTILLILTAIVALIFIGILIYLIVRGLPAITTPGFYSTTGAATVGAQIYNTFYILILAEIFLIPISLAAAIYLTEYARQGRFVTSIHFAAETLSGVPSIVLGLFGYALFSTYFGFGLSRMSGALTLLCLNFPTTLRLFEGSLSAVSRELREGGLALGATKWQTIRSVILPSALPGIITGIILSAGKIIGEAAALLFTMGGSNPINVFTLNPFIGSDTLTINIYNIQSTGNGLPKELADRVSAGSAALLVIILLLINLLARYLGNFVHHRMTAD